MALNRFVIAFNGPLPCLVMAAPATMQDANQLFRQGKHAQALDKIDGYLAANPKDAQGRFLKGLILTELNRIPESIKVFNDLTDDYPELPEPYNNLAVLYASQGLYDRAKNSLEMAIRTHPSYATAHENLGDIYAKMASIAYDKALALDSKNATAQTKLALIQDLIQGQPRKTAAKPVAQPAKPTAKPVVADPAPAKPAPASTAQAANAVEAAVNRWAQAWSARDVNAYLAAYASDYAADGLSRSSWEAQRRSRVGGPKFIEVQLSDLAIKQEGETATATFRQVYRSDRLTSTVTKTLKLALQNGQWRIVDESSK